VFLRTDLNMGGRIAPMEGTGIVCRSSAFYILNPGNDSSFYTSLRRVTMTSKNPLRSRRGEEDENEEYQDRWRKTDKCNKSDASREEGICYEIDD